MYCMCVCGGLHSSAMVVCECRRPEVGSPVPTCVNPMDGISSKRLCLLRHLDGPWSRTARLRLAEPWLWVGKGHQNEYLGCCIHGAPRKNSGECVQVYFPRTDPGSLSPDVFNSLSPCCSQLCLHPRNNLASYPIPKVDLCPCKDSTAGLLCSSGWGPGTNIWETWPGCFTCLDLWSQSAAPRSPAEWSEAYLSHLDCRS